MSDKDKADDKVKKTKLNKELDGLAPVKKSVSQIATLLVLDKMHCNLGF